MQGIIVLVVVVVIVVNICVFIYHSYLNSSSTDRMQLSDACPGAEDPEILRLLSQIEEQTTNHRCPYCHSELPAGAEFCSHCGRSLKPGGVKRFSGFGNDDRINEVNRWLADNPHICDAKFEFSAVRTPGAFTSITHLTGITISYNVSASWSNKQYAVVQLQKYRAYSLFDDIDRGSEALKRDWIASNPEARFVGPAAAYSSRETNGGSSSLQVFTAVEFPRHGRPVSQKQSAIPPKQAAPAGNPKEPYNQDQLAQNQKTESRQTENQYTAKQQAERNPVEKQQLKKKKGTLSFIVLLIVLFLLAFAAGIGYSYYMDASAYYGTAGYGIRSASIGQPCEFLNNI